MENGKYKVSALLAKAKAELVANQVAVGTMKDQIEKFRATCKQVNELAKSKEATAKFVTDIKEATKAVLVATGIIPEGYELSVSTTPSLTMKRLNCADYTAEFARIIRHLEAMSVEEIEWSRDVEWLLGDFTLNNTSTCDESIRL